MALLSDTAGAEDLDRGRAGNWVGHTSSSKSAVSWGAVAAGAAAAASLSLILLMLGVGLGLSSVSPWAADGVSAATFGVSTIVWLTFTQLTASAMGGYLAGRLRTRWADVPTDEVYFRDTAHGFLAWAVSTLATAALLTSVIGSILGGGVQAGAQVVAGVTGTARTATGNAEAMAVSAKGDLGGPMGYFVDALFRADVAGVAPTAGAPADAVSDSRDTAEVFRIFMNAGRVEALPDEDVRHVGQIVSRRTGLSQQTAEQRVVDVHARVLAQASDAEVALREAADAARKASTHGTLWLFVSLLVGAFVASLAATFGGRRRDA